MRAWINVKILDSKVPMYASANNKSRLICQLTDCPEVELTKGSGGFVEIKLADGRCGFVDGKVAIHSIKTMCLRQDQAPLYAAPGLNAPVVAMLERDARITTRGVTAEQDGIKWLNVTADSGQVGYIRGDVKVLILAATPRIERDRRDGMRNVLIGGGICLIGVLVTAGSYSAVSQHGGPYLVAWGAILFGGIQLFRGLSQLTTAATPGTR
ncbi:MAG: SH3 domain-containing protein [Tepidisphaeraceae bacterium]|jgi:hypothetical protein